MVAEMQPFLSDSYQNASSVAGEFHGVKRAMSRARGALARFLGVNDPSCLVFTSGAAPYVENARDRGQKPTRNLSLACN